MSSTIAFDFDGVILDSKQVVYQAMDGIFREKGISFSPDVFSKLFEENVWESLRKQDFSSVDKKIFLEKYLLPLSEDCTLFAGIADVIKSLQDERDIFVISSHHSTFIRKKLCDSGIDDCFCDIIGCDRIGNKTDHLTNIHAHYDSVLYVCDTAGDIKEATDAHAIAIAVTWGFHDRAILKQCKPKYIASNIQELECILKDVY